MAKILHISNDYSGSTVYMNLIRELDNLGVGQIVFTPIRGTESVGKNLVEFTNHSSQLIYSPILNWYLDRLLYPYKIYKIFKEIQKKVDFTDIDLIHAHTWYSDGGVAYFLAKKYKIPYIVSIRTTDLTVFQKKLAYLRPFGRFILKNSKSIILISASYLSHFVSQKSLQKIMPSVKEKMHIIPNGVDSYWIKNTFERHKSKLSTKRINLIYVGSFLKRKNVSLVQAAVIKLNQKNDYSFHLNIIGGGGSDCEKVISTVNAYPEYFTCHGKVFDKNKLAELYRSSDIFVMPSSSETFGLVYIEAMLQGLPILYTQYEGIDGFYTEAIGEKVKNSSVDEIADKLVKMAGNLNSYEIPIEKLKKNHDWVELAKKYLLIYNQHL